MNTSSRRFVVLSLSVLIAASGASVIAPHPAHAQFATVEVGPLETITGTISALLNGKQLLNPIFYALSQAAIQSMVHSTVNWINSGFQGSPAYVTDIKATLQDAADQQANVFVNQLLASSAINSPFRDQVATNVLQNYYLSTSRDGFFLQNPYTLKQYTTDDAAFANGDLTKGGLQAWIVQSIHPQNNVLGAQFLAQNELANQTGSVRSQLQTEANQSGGFLSWRQCDQQTTTLTGSTGGATGQTVPVIDATTGKVISTTAVQTVANLTPHQTCLASHIETPGSVIAANLNHTLGLGSDSLVQAKDFDEIVNALMAQLMNQVLGATGLGGLSGGSAATGGNDYFSQSTTQQGGATTASVSVVTSFVQLVNTQIASVQSYQANWQTISTAANAAKTALQSSTCVPNASTIVTNQVQPVITQAAAALGTAGTALTSLNKIIAEAQGAVGQGTSQQTATLQQANTEYTTLLSGNTVPDATAISYANVQASDTSNASTTAPSLYTQMTQLAAQARCGQ